MMEAHLSNYPKQVLSQQIIKFLIGEKNWLKAKIDHDLRRAGNLNQFPVHFYFDEILEVNTIWNGFELVLHRVQAVQYVSSELQLGLFWDCVLAHFIYN